MLKELYQQLKIAISLFLILAIITGLVYPLTITALAQFFFPWQANGSLIYQQDKLRGSMLIGQYFDGINYFWSRPSATQPYPYNGAASLGSNLSLSNPEFIKLVDLRVKHLNATDFGVHKLIPIDLVSTSASGLDPHISPYAAFYQVARIAKARKIGAVKLNELVRSHIIPRTFNLLGEPCVNVLELNLALDDLK